MEKNAQNIILFRCSKALYFHTFSKMFLSNFICSGMLKIAPEALHFLKFITPGIDKNITNTHKLLRNPFEYNLCSEVTADDAIHIDSQLRFQTLLS